MKFSKKLFYAGMLLSSLSAFADPQPYESVRNLSKTPYFVQDSHILYDLISSSDFAVIVDVESQDGSIARFIAEQAQNLPSLSAIYSVSAWKDCDHSKKNLFQRFLSNVKQENSANLIIPVRMNSLEAANALNITADLVCLSGGNDQDVIFNDILAWFHLLSDRGVICGNNWKENSVSLGVARAAGALNLPLKINNNVWYLEKNR